MISVVWKWYNW